MSPLPPPSLLSPSPLLNTKFFQIWSSVAGYGGFMRVLLANQNLRNILNE